MSSKVSGKTSDAKATVSFNSDSDDDSSSSSRLSSSASSEDESDVETVTFRVPLVSQDKNKASESSSATSVKKPTVAGSKNQEQVSKDNRADLSGTAASKSRLSPNKGAIVEAEVASKTVEVDHSPKKSVKSNAEDTGVELTAVKIKTTNAERSKSPKIAINDVEAPEVANDVRSTEKATKKSRSNSPKSATGDDTFEVGMNFLKSNDFALNKRSNSALNAGSEVEREDVKPSKNKTKITATTERQKSPKSESRTDRQEKSPEGSKSLIAAEEPEIVLQKARSTKLSSEESTPERAKSPKKTSRDKSPLDSTDVVLEPKKKSSKEATKALDELIRSAKSPEKSPIRTFKSNPESAQATDNIDEATTKTKKTKKTKTPKQEDNNTKDDKSIKITTTESTEFEKDSKDADGDFLKKSLTKAKDTSVSENTSTAEDPKLDQKYNYPKFELTSERLAGDTTSSSLGVSEVRDDLNDNRKTKSSRLNKHADSENDVTGLTLNDNEKTDIVIPEQKTSKKRDLGSDETQNDPSLKSSNLLTVDGGTKELVNEDSEFTYRRKSMDEFIKRILAEARDEKLKQKQSPKNDLTSTGTEEDNKVDKYADQNGDISREILGKPPKWTGGDKETSSLDKRLASIEKRRFGAEVETVKKGGSKGQAEEEEGGSKKKTVQNDTNDFDGNLDDDLEEINRFLQSRKSAASRFDFDEAEPANDTHPTVGKRRWLTDLETQGQQQPEVGTTDEVPKPQLRKKINTELDFDDDDDDDERFLGKFRRDREPLILPETLFSPRRRDETDEIVRERTRNVRVLVDQQVEIVQSMRNTSKNLDELEKEIREVRQVCLDRQARIEALEGALNAEYRAYESDHLAASDRHRSTDALPKEDFGRIRRQGKLNSDSLDEDIFPFRRRSGSVASVGSYSSTLGAGRSSDLGSDFSDLRPPSGLRQQRGSELRRSENESDYPEFDQRRAGSVNRDRGFGAEDPGALLNQRPARSRASIATSNPTLDFTGNLSADSFLSKIRAKYSFLAPAASDNSSYLGSTRGHGLSSYGTSLLSSSSSSSDFRLGGRPRTSLEETRSRTRDFLTSPSYTSPATGGYTPSYYSVRDSKSPSYGSGGFISGSSERMRRAQSVSDFSFDRPPPGGSGSSAPGGEFHSRFLDKVRGKKAMGEETTTTTTPTTTTTAPKGQDKQFKSRFLKTSSFDSTSSRSDRMTNGGLEDRQSGGGGGSEVNGDA